MQSLRAAPMLNLAPFGTCAVAPRACPETGRFPADFA
jgi:hypothetical protein